MKVIKNPGADLEKRRLSFFQIGIIVSCSLSLLAFRWTTYEFSEDKEYVPSVPLENLEIELPPISFREIAMAKAPKKVMMSTSVIDIVDVIPKVTDKVTLTLISPDELRGAIGDGTDPEPDVKDPVFPKGPSNWMKAERTPFFDECASPSDRESESACTYARIKNFVQSHTSFPETCIEMGIQGTVWLTFVIDKTGNVKEVEAVKSPHKLLTDAAMKGVEQLPEMNPGTQRLQPVDVRLEIPVRFILK